ncbi:MAG: DNA methyltransferase [Pyrinomonadaceae bacterium]
MQTETATSLTQINWDFTVVKTNLSTHGLHPYPAKYIPQIPAALIEELSNPQDSVADIFCGSGTTLVEALASGRNAVGVKRESLSMFDLGSEDSKIGICGCARPARACCAG